ncbi:MAG: COX15/CtaA family protein [Acidimicrobiales bacterium]
MRRLRVTPGIVRAVALAAVVGYALLVITGGAVRLTDSGLGCPDWPSCYQHRLTAAVSFHPMVEFLNRMFTIAVSVLSIMAGAAAVLRNPRRRDLTWLAGGLIAGLVAQIVLGGLVVLFKLNPYLVAFHFLLTIIVLAVAIVMFQRAGIPDSAASASAASPLVGSDLRWLTRLLLGALALVSTVGTIVTGSGPHAGGSGTRRIPVAFHDIAEFHSSFAWLLFGLTAASLFAFHHAGAPEVVQRRLRLLFEVMFVQGALGYTQYFLHDSPIVVEFHLAGVTTLWILAVGVYLSLDAHTPLAPTGVEQPTHEPARLFRHRAPAPVG